MFQKIIFMFVAVALTATLYVFNQATSAELQTITFAVVPKQSNVKFFKEIERGCYQAASKLPNVECLYRGTEVSDFRLQDRIISELLDEGVQGIAVSVINSDYLAAHSLKKAKELGVPVITFDSDLKDNGTYDRSSLRHGYVGTDNYEMGKELANGLLRLKPKGYYAMISGNKTATNLNERIAGIRDTLQGTGWTEFIRSPIYINDINDRALNALSFIYKSKQDPGSAVDAVIATSAALQVNDPEYRKIIEENSQIHKKNGLYIVSADTSPHQIVLVKEGLSHVNVGQSTEQMGAVSINLLYDLYRGKEIPEITYTALRICNFNKEPVCSTN